MSIEAISPIVSHSFRGVLTQKNAPNVSSQTEIAEYTHAHAHA